jgi:hypothetical protein
MMTVLFGYGLLPPGRARIRSVAVTSVPYSGESSLAMPEL